MMLQKTLSKSPNEGNLNSNNPLKIFKVFHKAMYSYYIIRYRIKYNVNNLFSTIKNTKIYITWIEEIQLEARLPLMLHSLYIVRKQNDDKVSSEKIIPSTTH